MSTQGLGVKGPINRSSSTPLRVGTVSPLPWGLRAVTAGSPPSTSYTIDQAKLVTNLLDGSGPVVTGLTGIELGATTKVWLKGTFDGSGNPTGWEVTTAGPSGDWITWTGTSPSFIQNGAWYFLGQVLEGSAPGLPGFDFDLAGSPYHYEQIATTQLIMPRGCVNGRIVFYPSPF